MNVRAVWKTGFVDSVSQISASCLPSSDGNEHTTEFDRGLQAPFTSCQRPYI